MVSLMRGKYCIHHRRFKPLYGQGECECRARFVVVRVLAVRALVQQYFEDDDERDEANRTFPLRCWRDSEHSVVMNVFVRLIQRAGVVGLLWMSGPALFALEAPGLYVAWGRANLITTNSPVAVGAVTQVAAGGFHALALRVDQTLFAWGEGGNGQTNIPVGLTNVVAISAGARHNLALRADGTVVAWGYNLTGQTNVPAGLSGVMAVAAGADHSVALRSNGNVVAWGTTMALTTVPASATNIVAIAAGSTATFALRPDGTVLAWGTSANSLTNLPVGLTNVAQISAGLNHSLAVLSNGTVVAWGNNAFSQISVPPTLTNAVAVSAGWLHSLALRTDGTLIGWGLSTSGQTTTPGGLTNIQSFAAGNEYNLAVDPAPRFLAQPPATMTLALGQSNTLSVTPLSGSPATLQWYFNNLPLSGATNNDLAITEFTPAQAGIYSATISNAFSAASAATIVRLSNAPTVQVNGVIIGGGSVTRTNSATITLTATTNAYANLRYTLDGSPPDFTSAVYTNAFVTSNSVIIRAVAYNNLFTDQAGAAPVALQVIPTYPLTTNGPGGSIAVSPAANLNPNLYLSNSLVKLTATPSNGWTFMYWTGAVSSTASVINVLMDQPRHLQAVFGTTLNLFTNGNGQIVTDPPTGPFPHGSSVTLTALPAPTSYFFGWAGLLSGFTNPVTLTVNNASGITALFGTLNANQVSLVALPVGGGSLGFSPARNVYTNGEVVTITALSTSNRIFSTWSGAATGSANPLALPLDGNKLLYGHFIPGTPTNLPVFTMIPSGRTLSVGASTILAAQATGVGPLQYQWRLNGVPVSGATETNLVLTNLTAPQAGLYDVVVNGAFGASISPAVPVALLGLQFAPSVGGNLPLLIVDCAPGAQFELQYLGDLRLTNWALLAPLTLPSSRFYFIDSPPPNVSQRYYRLVPE